MNEASSSSLRSQLLTAWLHLAVLWSLAFCQPLFEVLADSPDFFVARGNTRGDILLLAFGLTLIPPTLLVGIELLFLRSARLRWLVHTALIGLLCSALALQVVEGLVGGSTAVLFAIALLLGALAAFAYARKPAVRSVLTVLGPAPALFLVLFLLFSPVSKLVLPENSEEPVAATIGGDTPVVVVTFDEFAGYALMGDRARIDASRYPNFAALARRGTWFPNATTVSSSTTYAVPAILSGQVPEEGDLPILSDHPVNLFTAFGDEYRFSVNEPATDLCPVRLCGERDRGSAQSRVRALFDDLSVVSLRLLLPPDLDKHLPAVDQTFGGFRDDDGGGSPGSPSGSKTSPDAGIPAAAFHNRPRQWNMTIAPATRPSSRPTLTFAHVLLPHMLWEYLPSGQQYATAGPDVPGVNEETWGADPRLSKQGYQRFLLQAGFADHLLGKLIDRLRSAGMYDRALIVVTADHGVSFHPGLSRRNVSRENFAEIASVPLFVKLPGQDVGRVDDRMARTVDVLPTIQDALGARQTGDGRSLNGSPLPPGQVTVENGAKDPVSVPFGTFRRLRDAAVLNMARLFGVGNGASGVFQPPGDLEYVGRPVSSDKAAPRSSMRAELDFPGLYADVEPGGSLVPAFVTGRLTGDAAPGTRLAVAVNGRVRGLASAYSAPDGMRFGAIVAPAAFRPGTNKVEVFAITSGDGTERLALVPRTDTAISGKLLTTDGSQVIQLSPGGSTKVTATGFAGALDVIEIEKGSITASGWAVDTDRSRSVDRILIFARDKLVATGEPAHPRPDIAKQFGNGAQQSGFQVSGAVSGDAPAENEVHVFAVSGDLAAEIKPWSGTVR